MHWMAYAAVAIVLWGVNGLFMKLGTNRVSARSMVIWVTVGFLVLLPLMWKVIDAGRSEYECDLGRADCRDGQWPGKLGSVCVPRKRRQGQRGDSTYGLVSTLYRNPGDDLS